MGDVSVGHRWDRVAMDILDMSVLLCTGNCGLFFEVDGGLPLPNKTALAVADAFFQLIVCRFGMPAVIHSNQGREFENNLMQELCLLCGVHKTRTTPYHPISDGLVERFNRTLLMMLAMFAGENWDDWDDHDDLLRVVMMAYRSSVHKSTGRLMFGEECTLPMDVGLPRRDHDLQDPIKEVTYDQICCHSGQAVRRQKRLYDKQAVRRLFDVGHWTLRYYPPAKKCKLNSPWIGPYLVVSLAGWAMGVQLHPDSLILLIHCQDLKKIPRQRGLVSWIDVHLPDSSPTPPVLGASTVCHSTRGSTSPTGSVARQQQSDDRIADSTQPSPGSILDGPGVSNMNLSSLARSRVVAFLPQEARDIDNDHVLHPFFHHRLDVGPIRLTSIAPAFNYRIAVLRDGAKLAARVGHSQGAARQILDDVDIL